MHKNLIRNRNGRNYLEKLGAVVRIFKFLEWCQRNMKMNL